MANMTLVVIFLQTNGKDILYRQPADGKELADGKDPDSSSVPLYTHLH